MKNQIETFFIQYVMSSFGMLAILWALSCVLMLIIGTPLIKWLKFRKSMKWAPREDTPDTHLQKAGVPSMGGIGIIGAATLAWMSLLSFGLIAESILRPRISAISWETLLFTIFPILVILHMILGYLDDHSKATNKGGLSSKTKLLGQIILAALFLGILSFLSISVSGSPSRYHANQPNEFFQFKSVLFDSWISVLAAFLIIIGTSNAVNLTDGIDGLAAGLSVQIAIVFSVLFGEAFAGVNSSFAPFSVGYFWPALGGACLGFLAFNKHPAKVFMGDTGSLALGAALGAGAILTRTVWLLPFVGFIFYVEMFSVIAQVLYFKYTRKKTGEGKRLFRRAPLHHHFELGGWSEWRVVATFWGVNLVTTIVGLVLWKMGILPRFP